MNTSREHFASKFEGITDRRPYVRRPLIPGINPDRPISTDLKTYTDTGEPTGYPFKPAEQGGPGEVPVVELTAACFHPLSCRGCDRNGRACGLHRVGDSGHDRCTGR